MRTRFNFSGYTYDDYKNWKDDWELIEGFPVQLLPSPSAKHSKTQVKFIIQAGNSINAQGADCNCVLFTELDWKINEGTVVRPDIMIVCGESKGEYLNFPPVLIIEILSPHNLRTDRVIKFDLYREQGVKFYLMIDCNKETVEAFELIDNLYKQVDKSSFKIDKNCEVDFDFEDLWT